MHFGSGVHGTHIPGGRLRAAPSHWVLRQGWCRGSVFAEATGRVPDLLFSPVLFIVAVSQNRPARRGIPVAPDGGIPLDITSLAPVQLRSCNGCRAVRRTVLVPNWLCSSDETRLMAR